MVEQDGTARPDRTATAGSSADRVQVLLATYNSAPYLEAQLDSVLGQTHASLDVLARDDGSSDDTLELLHRYADSHPGRVTVLEDSRGNLGPSQNFGCLMGHSDAPYVAFCDADDVWLPHKIERTLAELQRIEGRVGSGTPALVHNDLAVVDGTLQPISPSMWRYMRLEVESAGDLRRMLVANAVTGNSTLMNRALVALADPVPPECIMHDWWVALVAAAAGEVGEVDEALIQYRQHGGNVLGAKEYSLMTVVRRTFAHLGKPKPMKALLRQSYAQARVLQARVQGHASREDVELIGLWASIADLGPLARRAAVLRGRFYMPGRLRRYALLYII